MKSATRAVLWKVWLAASIWKVGQAFTVPTTQSTSKRLCPLQKSAIHESELDQIDDSDIQWELFKKHHAKGAWKGVWTTFDYIGDVLDETVASVVLQSDETTDSITQTHQIVVGAKRADCETCFDSMQVKDFPVATYTAEQLTPRKIRLGACGMVVGPTIMKSGAIATELILSHGDGRVRVTFQHAPVWERGVEPGTAPPNALKLFRTMISREALRDAPPTADTEQSNPPAPGNPVFFRPVPPFNWHKKWGGTCWTWGPSIGNKGWGIQEMEEGDSWHGSAPVELWNLRLPGGVFVQAPRLLTDATAALCRLAWLPDDETLLRLEAGVLALQPVIDEENDALIGFYPPSLASYRCDMMSKMGELDGEPQFVRDEKQAKMQQDPTVGRDPDSEESPSKVNDDSASSDGDTTSTVSSGEKDPTSSSRTLSKSLKRSGTTGVTLKIAIDSNGGVVDLDADESVRFTSPQSLDMVHRLRRDCDAVLVGRGTVEADDPSLTIRRVNPFVDNCTGTAIQPIRVVLDPGFSLGLQQFTSEKSYKIFEDGFRSVVYHSVPDVDFESLAVLDSVDLVHLPRASKDDSDRTLSVESVVSDLSERYDVQHLMVEGGPATAQTFLKAGLVDRVVIVKSAVEFRQPLASNITPDILQSAGLELRGSYSAGPDEIECWSKSQVSWQKGIENWLGLSAIDNEEQTKTSPVVEPKVLDLSKKKDEDDIKDVRDVIQF